MKVNIRERTTESEKIVQAKSTWLIVLNEDSFKNEKKLSGNNPKMVYFYWSVLILNDLNGILESLENL